MKLKFRHKVFLAFLLNSFAIVICMLLIARHFASRNFEQYVGKVEMERLNRVADILSHAYDHNRGWDPVLANWGQWLRLMAIGPRLPPRSVDGETSPFLSSLSPPSPHMGRGPRGEEPPPFDESPPPHPPPGRPHGPEGFAPRVVLLDAKKQPLAGAEAPSTTDYRLQPILVDGQVVGWLGMQKRERLTHPLDMEFLRIQSQTFYSIGVVALVLAVLVTFLLSRHFSGRVKELAEGARALTSRRFDTRIAVRSRDEFGQLARDFNAMAQALERYEQMRLQWMADISHELRTPLAILRGEIEAMQDGVRELTQEALQSLHFEVQHVSRIVHDLHDLSLIESRPFDPEQSVIAPHAVLEETLKSFRTRFEQRSLRIEANGEGLRHVKIRANADRLKQLFSNLLENTLRYADAPGVLRISHDLTPHSLSLHFEDSGPGVPDESLGRLFDRLYRVDKARSRAEGGSGLGLAICKSIVEGCGGQIKASNSLHGGLRISLALPLVSDGAPMHGQGSDGLGRPLR
jgi:two-component system, OmpR family, sensor histidine kinase BaeS